MRGLYSFLVVVVLSGTALCYGQGQYIDTLKLKNQDVLIGEIKELDSPILIMKTMYSKKDFQIDFTDVEEISLGHKSQILLTKGRRRYGSLLSDGPGRVKIITNDSIVERYELSDVIAFEEVSNKWYNRFRANIDLGYNLTKQDNRSQFSIGGLLNFTGEKWIFDGNITVLNTRQDDADDIKRTDGGLQALRILDKRWFVAANMTYLSNSGQSLAGRTNMGLSAGYMLITTRQFYFAIAAGLTYNIEEFTDDTPDQNSTEALSSLNFHVLDIKDLTLTSTLDFFPSLSEQGRVRLDYNLTAKYWLPWDFYIKAEYTLNYDNQPAATGAKLDYILTTGFGWDWR